MDPRILGRYTVRQKLGSGGAATAWLCTDEVTGEDVTVKKLRSMSSALLDSLRREVEALRGARHPNLVRALRVARERDSAVLVTQYIDGTQLHDGVDALVDVLRGLAHLHRHGVRHGDVKAANVLVDKRGRAVLIDLGACVRFGPVGEFVSGTLDHAAPEVLARGKADARADLYSFGVMLSQLPSAARWKSIWTRLTATDPNDRPSSAGAVIAELDPAAELVVADPLPVAWVGRSEVDGAVDKLIASLKSGSVAPRTLALVGPSGSGRTRALAEVGWRVAVDIEVLEASPCGAARPPFAAVAGRVELPPPRGAADVAEMIERMGDGPLRVILVDGVGDDLTRREQVEALARAVGDRGPVAVVVADGAPPEAATQVELRPLVTTEVAEWLGGHVPAGDVPALTACAEGRPAAIAQVADALHTGRLVASSLPGLSWRTANQERAHAWLQLAEPMREAVGCLAVAASDADAVLLSPSLRSELVDAGWLDSESGQLSVEDAHCVGEAATRSQRAGWHARVAEAVHALPGRLLEAARHWALAGNGAHVVAALRGAASSEDVDAFRAVLTALVPQSLTTADDALCAADWALAVALPKVASACAARARRLGATPAATGAYAGAADVERGNPARGERRLGAAVKVGGSLLPLALASWVTALNKRGAFTTALAIVDAHRPRCTGASPASMGELAASAATAASSAGDMERARQELAAAEAAVAATKGSGGVYRARLELRTALARAHIELRSGRASAAAAVYRDALVKARALGDDSRALTAAVNLGAASHQHGALGDALSAYALGVRLAAALAEPTRHFRCLFNLGVLYADISQTTLARRALEEARDRSRERGVHGVQGAAALVLAELALTEGDAAGARRDLAEASGLLQASGAGRELAELALAQARLSVLDEDAAAARDHLARAIESARAANATDVLARIHLELARRELAGGHGERALAELDLAAPLADEGGQRLLVAEVAEAHARAFRLLGAMEAARAAQARAAEGVERVALSLPAPLRHRLREARAASTEPNLPQVGGDGQLRQLLAIYRRLASAETSDDVLRETLDAAIELAGAERGFLIVATRESGARRLQVPVARNLDREQVGRSHLKFSRGIAQQVVERGETVVTTDAGEDPRFRSNRSVHSMRLKSVLCVPIVGAAGVLGAIYLDHRFKAGGFAAAELERVTACADQAALALGKARLTEQLAARTRELEAERAQVAALVSEQRAQLAQLTAELDGARAHVQPDMWPGIIGKSPAFADALAVIERAAAADVTVLIRGESGTGKELAAKALHTRSARTAGPFVAINCGALPENLLEAELFGYERGAFTGADRARTGLLVSAATGTVFLDEIGEMPAAMQVKLLRVLQEREVRPLGAAATVSIDVRIVAATHRDLAAEVKAGRFREDLYYRVAVVEVHMPPLRERVTDIPTLAVALITRIAGDLSRPVPRIDDSALRALMSHPWPGNVRELQNALTKAVVLCEGGIVRAVDLGLVAARASRRKRGDKPSPEAIDAALASAGNRRAAAAQLGVSRATFYRWLGER